MKQLSLSTNRMIEKPWDYVGLTLPNGGYLEDEKEVLAYASSIGHDEFVDFNDEDVTPNNIDWVLEEGIFTVKDVMSNRVHSLTSIVPRDIQNKVKEGDIIRVINPNDDNDWVFVWLHLFQDLIEFILKVKLSSLRSRWVFCS